MIVLNGCILPNSILIAVHLQFRHSTLPMTVLGHSFLMFMSGCLLEKVADTFCFSCFRVFTYSFTPLDIPPCL